MREVSSTDARVQGRFVQPTGSIEGGGTLKGGIRGLTGLEVSITLWDIMGDWDGHGAIRRKSRRIAGAGGSTGLRSSATGSMDDKCEGKQSKQAG